MPVGQWDLDVELLRHKAFYPLLQGSDIVIMEQQVVTAAIMESSLLCLEMTTPGYVIC